MSQKKIKTADTKAKDLDPNQDQFISKSVTVLDWVYAHRRPIGALIFLALLSAVAGILIRGYIVGKKADYSAALGEGLKASTAPLLPKSTDDESAKKPDGDESLLTFESSKARATEMLKRWQQVAKGTEPDFRVIADLGLATSNFELKEYGKAAELFRAFLSNKDKTLRWLRPAAMEGLGYALEAQGKLDEARQTFETMMGETDSLSKRAATYHAARMAQLKGDNEGAKKLLKQVMESYGETDKPGRFDIVFVQARTRLLELDPKAEVPDMPAGGMGAFDGIDPRLLQQLMQAQQGAGAS